MRVRALRADENPAGLFVIAVISRRLRADWCVDKDGLRVGRRRLRRADILGVVLEVAGASPYSVGDGWYWDWLRARVAGTASCLAGHEAWVLRCRGDQPRAAEVVPPTADEGEGIPRDSRAGVDNDD